MTKIIEEVKNIEKQNMSIIGRLVEEISWAGQNVKKYRNGGVGYENVLTAEILQALDLLPRKRYFAEIIRRSHGRLSKAKSILIKEMEDAKITFLPGNHYLKPSLNSHQKALAVQPDAIINTPKVFTLVEAKRLKTCYFMPQQLAREYVIATRNCKARLPFLLLFLRKEPPIKVNGHGRMNIKENILLYLEEVIGFAENYPYSINDSIEMIDDVVSWITWGEIKDIVNEQLEIEKEYISLSNYNSFKRIVDNINYAINIHR